MKSLIHGGERLMALRPEFPLTIQADRTVWLETRHPGYEPARDALARFADLERSAGPIHVYRITPLSIWNAAALGLTAAEILEDLERFSGGQVPEGLREDIRTWMARYGRLRLEMGNGRLWLVADDPALLAWVRAQSVVAPFLAPSGEAEADRVAVEPRARGALKQALLYLGYPVEDMAGYVEGARLDLRLRSTSRTTGEPFRLRPYQEEAVEAFLRAGSGVILLPCGAGKTIVGLGVMARLRTATLIIATSTVAARQWITEILDKTDLSPDQVGEYTGHRKQIRPVTVATYQILTHRPHRDFEEDLLRQFPHFRLFSALDWGLIIYDEVHLLPAPGLPHHRPAPGPPAPGSDGHPGAGGRAGAGGVRPHRPPSATRPPGGSWRPGAGSPRPSATRSASRWPRRIACDTWPRRKRSATAWRPPTRPRSR
jgi:DNA excision repair protein ERCC-3